MTAETFEAEYYYRRGCKLYFRHDNGGKTIIEVSEKVLNEMLADLKKGKMFLFKWK